MTFRNEDLPALFHHTDQAAISRQRESTQATRAQLLLLVTAAAAGALPAATRLGSLHLFGLLSALAYAGVLGVGVRATRRRARPQWQLNRSAAEFIKSLAWRYAVHGAPFGSDVPDPRQVYGTRLEAGLDELRKMGWEDPRTTGMVPEGGEITGAMHRLRGLDYRVRRETYVRDRLIEQRKWYQRKTEVSRRATAVWSWSIVLLTCVALLFALLGAVGSGPGTRLTGLLSAAAAAGIAWNEVRRHHPLIEAHTLIEQDLSAMMVVMQTTITETQWPSAVYETERYVSPQHTDWLARHSS
ncbi:DUF4231 domain-containing protein [Streptomyces sp. G-G2]|uniref:DUF4231 domain-containing protein n=1 Tax=Streptomyces sp. G-G2 TaxID=3046201 RepID=UPI0024B947E3|nr:DUF4231 domain-containing protein [Streptomyces sp. G-G2]MDJ0385405.1 DUF4231 domain-containing protein [Streptomyces sp. G-G2]